MKLVTQPERGAGVGGKLNKIPLENKQTKYPLTYFSTYVDLFELNECN